MTLFAKILAGTVDVNHVMSGLNMMTTPATGVLTALLNVALYVDYTSSMSVWTVSML